VEAFYSAVCLGMIGVVCTWEMLRREQSADHSEEEIWGPLSLVTVSGRPYRWIHPWKNPAAQSAAVTVASGMASGQRVVLSSTIRR
jgi:hypothetical protein